MFLAFFFLAGAGFAQNAALMQVGGLLQRVTIAIGWSWITALAVQLLRRPYPPRASRVTGPGRGTYPPG